MTVNKKTSRDNIIADPPNAELFDEALNSEIELTAKRFPTRKAALLPVLWLCQERWGWISPNVMREVADRLGVTPAHVSGVVSFHQIFRTDPPPPHLVEVCTALSCHVRGAELLVADLTRHLCCADEPSEGRVMLAPVRCLAQCGSGPNVRIDHGPPEGVTPENLPAVIDRIGILMGDPSS